MTLYWKAYTLRDKRFSQRWCWNFKFSGVSRHDHWYVVTEVSKDVVAVPSGWSNLRKMTLKGHELRYLETPVAI